MARMSRSTIAAVLTLATTLLLGRAAFAVDDAEAALKATLQGVVSQQLDALSRGDAQAAEAFAAPAIRSRFPDPAQFLAMVQNGYRALINPRSSTFAGFENPPSGPMQTVTVVAADGTIWTAVYAFENVDGDWRITGVDLRQDKSQQAI